VDLLGLGEHLAPVVHPGHRHGVELVEAVHHLLAALVEPEALPAPEPRSAPGDEVRVVVEPPRRRWKRSI
jgi:hypothetical protein